MRTFRKASIFLIVNICVGVLFSTLFTQPSSVRILVSEAKSGDYDTLILGQSHAETSIDPMMLSEDLDCEAFDLARRVMPVLQQYYLLREANKKHTYKRVIFDIDPTYWNINHRRNAGRDTNIFWNLSGSNQWDYFRNVCLKDNYNDSLFDYSITALTTDNIAEMLQVKLSRAYIEKDSSAIEQINKVTSVASNYDYKGRGFRYGVHKSCIQQQDYTFEASDIKEECLTYFAKMVQYCKDQGIELICVQSALPPSRLKAENMDDVHDYFTKLCSKYDVPFYDMNYIKKEYLGQKQEDYVDPDGHMMGELAERHTKALEQVITSSDPKQYFYTDYQEVLDNLQD